MNWVLAGSVLLLVVLGVLSGYFLAIWRMRRMSGGKTPAEMQKELDDYRDQVSEHFAESAQLLGKMTEQYREVYSHIARGAHKLGTGDEMPPRVEQLRAKLVEDGSTRAALETGDSDSDVESQAPESADQDRPEDVSDQAGMKSESDNESAPEPQEKPGDSQSASQKAG